jgi:hypothetical protein
MASTSWLAARGRVLVEKLIVAGTPLAAMRLRNQRDQYDVTDSSWVSIRS